ncbi:hypothetical protein RJ640_000555 [Escallonia rubra]|uniref:Peptidase C1A papain C-terminal domain-containing protein n=1 Tax=Escallonia rubra TaxID=112253 RepID=A0AA88S0F2_9ASTE|nr:hypothetical protein RJ640_000555 [Escallonia rubra]
MGDEGIFARKSWSKEFVIAGDALGEYGHLFQTRSAKALPSPHPNSGVFIGDCSTDLDHGVTAVGYDTAGDGTKYWLVKNSWGTGWGKEGYVRMQRGIDAAAGLCGIAIFVGGCQACPSNRMPETMLEGDSSTTIAAVRNIDDDQSQPGDLMDDVKILARHPSEVHVSRFQVLELKVNGCST